MKREHCFLRIILGLLFFILIIILLPSCVTEKKKAQKDPFFDKWKVRAEQSKGQSPVIKRRIVDLPKGKVAKPGQKPAVETKKSLPVQEISMSMHNVDLSVLIRTLARAVNIPIVINESVKGKTNLNIQEQPWDQVFQAVLESNGLAYSWVGNIIRIMTLEDRELDLQRAAQKQSFKTMEPLVIKVVPIHYAEAKALNENLTKFLTKTDNNEAHGSISVDSHTNSLIIQAIESDIYRLITLVEELDRPTLQVLIEAHIVQARRTLELDLGIEWSGAHYSGAGGGGSGGGTPPTATGTTVDAASSLTGLSLGYFTQKLGKYALEAQLNALESEGKINVLSSPSITTLDNQLAIIESGKEVPYNKLDEAGNTTTQFKDAVLRMEVTPHTIDANTLSLKIKVKKDEVDSSLIVGGEPAIITKKAETKVVLFDGQTTVIGGLNEENTDDTDYGIPILKDIPVLGYLFKGIQEESKMDDLLIFITPYILEEHATIETKEE
jgi:type IV pilus assembly protein PilQ